MVINRDCYKCSETVCRVKPGLQRGLLEGESKSTSESGVGKGPLAGGIVGAILFVVLAAGLYFWLQRRARLKASRGTVVNANDKPAPAETVLRRPDPMEKPIIPPYPRALYHIGLDDLEEGSGTETSASYGVHYASLRNTSRANPFHETSSIQTAGSEGTNVIPIALVSGDSNQPSILSEVETRLSNTTGTGTSGSSSYLTPAPRLNLDHVNVSNDSRVGNPYEETTTSGLSVSRRSYTSGMTTASEMLNEAPTIMTPTMAPIRQVMGVARPEMIDTGLNDGLRPAAFARPTVTSPLASTSFGPNDAASDIDSQDGNPFDDKHSSGSGNLALSPAPSTTTFGHKSSDQDRQSTTSGWSPTGPDAPWTHHDDDSRPSSIGTQGSVVDIASATRVMVGLTTPGTATSTTRTYRTTMGRLVSPSSMGHLLGTLEEQQAWALAHAQAQAQAQGLDKSRPVSGSSMVSGTSTRADSILESFPFVPPSPISSRPLRSPPVSPLGQQSFTIGSSPLAQQSFAALASPLTQQTFSASPIPERTVNPNNSTGNAGRSNQESPANRRTLALSTASQFSTASTGLGSFTFQIDDAPEIPPNPTFLGRRQRASLNTLALTNELSSYPLGFDRELEFTSKKGQR
ncbi:hypothetical protein FA15DRAFT_664812 [Coprinopsis marcescibilis]|uniref:Membrane anchor Opy2 N-terminal domain-containing protein n=1 Tax=Coprinopsis marcescibilis TaxID=230819 RepID=A0A5C3L7Z8_COPMA|nr:hypothetical protein FA15DRAFT_664812 [Coprinopsis marcescibilis]